MFIHASALISPADLLTEIPFPVATYDVCLETFVLVDVNLDGQVGVTDLLMLLGEWGPCDECASDPNLDGVIDVVDLLTLLAAWGPSGVTGCSE